MEDEAVSALIVYFSVSGRDHATWPDHIVDVKRAIAWARIHAAEYGGDPNWIAIAGQSAGGHLAALAGVTANDPKYQPGFEDADTSLKVGMALCLSHCS